jgi:NRPS condensation-like uncharacterized protein
MVPVTETSTYHLGLEVSLFWATGSPSPCKGFLSYLVLIADIFSWTKLLPKRGPKFNDAMKHLRSVGVSQLASDYKDLTIELINHEIKRFSQISGAMQPVDAVQSAGAMPPAGAMQLSSPNEFDFFDTGIAINEDTFDTIVNAADGLMDWEWDLFLNSNE